MTQQHSNTQIPAQRSPEAEHDNRPRFLRWLLPTACASAVPLDAQQQAELKFIAFH